MLWYSVEAPRQGTSNEYPQHMFLLRNKKGISIFRTKKSSLSVAMLPHLVHMIKVVCMPICGEKASPESNGHWPWGLVCNIRDMGPVKSEKNDNLRLTLNFCMEMSFFFFFFLHRLL